MNLTKEYYNCLSTKLQREIIDCGVNDLFSIRGENPTLIRFKDIQVTTTQAEGKEPITTYQKRTKETVVIDEDGNTEEVEKWVDYTQETLDLIAEIEGVVAAHDPTPVENGKTEIELLKENNALLGKEILKLRMVI